MALHAPQRPTPAMDLRNKIEVDRIDGIKTPRKSFERATGLDPSTLGIERALFPKAPLALPHGERASPVEPFSSTFAGVTQASTNDATHSPLCSDRRGRILI